MRAASDQAAVRSTACEDQYPDVHAPTLCDHVRCQGVCGCERSTVAMVCLRPDCLTWYVSSCAWVVCGSAMEERPKICSCRVRRRRPPVPAVNCGEA